MTALKRSTIVILFSAVSAAACSTVRVRVPVLRPAEINLRGKNEIVIGEITGENPTAVENNVKQAIGASDHLRLVDRDHMDKVMAELALSASDLADPESRKKLGKQMTGSILLVGRVETNRYDENTWEDDAQCTRSKKGKTVEYRCVHHYRKGTATLNVGFDIIDIETGENIRPKRLSCSKSTTTKETDHNPRGENLVTSVVRAATGHEKRSKAPPIDQHSLLEACNQQVVASLMKAIAPWQDYVEAPFLKDGDVPQLELGINYAKQGDWKSALEQFRGALEFVGTQPGMAVGTIAKVHWDLGLAYEYTNQFAEAETEIKAAYDALPEGGCFIAIENIIDDARRENAFGLLMSLNMLIEFGEAFDFTAADFRGWCQEAGFKRFDLIPLAGPASAAVAYK